MANKIYTVVKDGEELEKLKTLTAAKKLADMEGAEVYSEGRCVYQGAAEGSAESVPEADAAEEPAPAKAGEPKEPETHSYRLKKLMNVRRKPSLEAAKLGTKPAGTLVRVLAIEDDWMRLADGSFILYGGGKFAERA